MKYYILLLGILFFITGCSKENELEPSCSEADWFVIHDDPNDPVQHAAYEVYSDWGIPVFCNDTIGNQVRGTDYYGKPIVYYKILDLNYNLNNPSNAFSVIAKQFSLIRNEDDKLAGIKFVNKMLLPVIPEVFYIKSILLLDSIYEQQYVGGTKNLKKVHQAMEVLAVADIPRIADMSMDEKEERVSEIVSYLAINYLARYPSDDIEKFKQVSYDPVTQRSYYKMQVRLPLYPGQTCLPPARWEEYGFLDYDPNRAYVSDPDVQKWVYYLPDETADIEDYIMAVISYSKNDFKAKYAQYSKVLEKFEIMRGIMETIGFDLK